MIAVQAIQHQATRKAITKHQQTFSFCLPVYIFLLPWKRGCLHPKNFRRTCTSICPHVGTVLNRQSTQFTFTNHIFVQSFKFDRPQLIKSSVPIGFCRNCIFPKEKGRESATAYQLQKINIFASKQPGKE